MSWDNVSNVSNIKIWTDYSDPTQGHLFVNNQHQLKLNVGITFDLDDDTVAGPTNDEVLDALSLINNRDSGPLKYLQITDEGKYTAIYDPSNVQSELDEEADKVGDGIYDYQFVYFISSPTSINAEVHAESIALQLLYSKTDTDETLIQTSTNGEFHIKTYVNVVCYPQKLYDDRAEYRTNIKVSRQDVAEDDCWDYSGTGWNHDGDTFMVAWFYIDDSYFKFYDFDGAKDADDSHSIDPFYIYMEHVKPEWDHIYNTYFPSVKCGEMDYNIQIAVRPDLDSSHKVIFHEHITVHQKENQITFVAARTAVQGLDYATDTSKRVRITTSLVTVFISLLNLMVMMPIL